MTKGWIKTILATVVAATLVVMAGPQMPGPEPESESDWNVYTPDMGYGEVGKWTSIALDSDGKPHISYQDMTNTDLKYARWTGSMWEVERVGAYGMHTSIALDSNDRPHISYYDDVHADLKYAKWDGSDWKIQDVQADWLVGEYSSIALDGSNYPHISFYDASHGNLKYAKWTGSTWSITTVDSDDVVGRDTSIAIDGNGRPHISYYDYTNKNLKYAKWTGSAWSITTVDSDDDVGRFTSIAIDSNGRPHISYFDGDNEYLKYAKWTGSSWVVSTVDSSWWDVGSHTSIALDSNDRAHISYTDIGKYDLRYAKWTGSAWDIQTIDSEGYVGEFTSIDLDSSNKPHISYYSITGRSLKYTRFDGADWNAEIVDSGSGYVGWYTSLALDSEDQPHISYHDVDKGRLSHAEWLGAEWKITIADYSDVGWWTSIAVDSNDYSHISYYDYYDKDLMCARWSGTSWGRWIVDSDDDVGLTTSIAVDSNDYSHISYFDATSKDLKYAKFTGSGWDVKTVDSSDEVGGYSSIAIDSEDNPHISYYDSSNERLKYAKWTGSSWDIKVVDSSEKVGLFSSMSLDSNDDPHIGYYDAANGRLKYAKWTGSSWDIKIVDSNGNVGWYASMDLDSNDNPHISYYDYIKQDLKYAKWTGSAWSIKAVDTEGDVGKFTSIAIDSNDNPHISYYENEESEHKRYHDLKYASTVHLEPVHNINKNRYYYGIQLAVDDADSGDTIEVRSGTFKEGLDISKPLTLIGAGKERTIIEGDSSRDVVRIFADGVSLSGFSMNKGGSGWAGIKLYSVSDCHVFDNKLYYSTYGIHLKESEGNSITGNNASRTTYGIFLEEASGNSITGNNASSYYADVWGIYLAKSSGNDISGNNMTGVGIGLSGDQLEHWNGNEIDTTNTVNGKPVYYWKNQTGGTVPSGAGQIILANSSNIVIEGQEITETSAGIMLGFSSDNLISGGNEVSYSEYGIYLYESGGNNITGNNATYNEYGIYLNESHENDITDNNGINNDEGIYLTESDENTIMRNKLWYNLDGIRLTKARWNNITENDFVANDYGVYIEDECRYNNLYHNNFIANYVKNARSESYYNNWQTSYPSGGNYWSDYAGSDHFTGPWQDVLGSDGIGDTPYYISGTGTDYYPLRRLWVQEQPPVADANGPYVGTEGSFIAFDASGSSDPDGDSLQYRWDFDNDGNWDTGWSGSPVEENKWDDDYTGTVVVEITDGQNLVTDTAIVTVNNVEPQVSVGNDMSVVEGDTVFFSATVLEPGSDTLTYEWDFGDDVYSTEPTPSHMYEDNGPFTVTLKVEDDDGGIGSDSLIVTVANVGPTVSLGPDLIVDEGITIPLSANAIDPSPVDVLTYEWDLDNDGEYDDETGQSVSWNAEDDGEYTISVRVTDDDDGVGTDSLMIKVTNIPPIAFLGPDLTIDEGETVTLSVASYEPCPLDVLTYEWDFDNDGEYDDETGQSVSWNGDDDGEYTISVRVTDDDGGVGMDSMKITVLNVPPVAIASVDQNPTLEGVEVSFTGGVAGGSDTHTYQWEFGDGGMSALKDPTHAYMDDGIFAANLTVTDDDGCSDTTTIIMYVYDREPLADAGSDRSVTLIDEVTFDGSGSQSYPDSIVSYEWDFDDGETATGMTVKHTFGAIGTYTVTLMVTDDDGSVDTDTAIVKVLAPGVELIVGEIVFSPPSPLDVGVDVTISSDITNYGNTDASNVIVRFYDGDPDENDDGKPDNDAVQIGDDIAFTSIESESTVGVSVTWTSTLGYHDIYVWADPDDYIPEYDDTNNQAHDMIVVGPDLIVLNLEFSPTSPIAVGDTVTISVNVINNGGSTVTDVLVRFYEEYPDQNNDGFEDSSAIQIEDRIIDSLAPGETETVWVSWSPSDVEIYDLSVWVDPAVPSGGGWGGIQEAIETNNIATDMMKVGPDLSIVFTDISFSENPVSEGTTVTITAVIHNDGGQDASGVIVKFYDNEIKNKNLIDSETISSLGSGSTETVTITWVADGIGYHDIWVVIDQRNDIEEFDETNNEAYNVLSVVE